MRVPVLQFRPGRPSDRRAPDLRDDRIGRERTRGLSAAPVRLRRVASASLWIALLAFAALLPAIRLADAQFQAPQILVSNTHAGISGIADLSTVEVAQGFTTGDNLDGYTLTSIVLDFRTTAPANVTLKLLRGLPSSPVEVATLTNPRSLQLGPLRFNALADTVLSPETTYFVHLQATAGNVEDAIETTENSGAAQGWTIGDAYYERSSGGTWTLRSNPLVIRVIGYIRMLPEIPAPDPANFARGPVHWLGQDQGQSQDQAQSSTHAFPAGLNQISDEPRASTHAFPVQLNEISANQPSNPSGSLDLGPVTASVSENLRQQSRGFYLTTTVDPPSDAPWLFQRTPEGGYAAQDAQSRRYALARGAPLLKLRLWHVYHHLGRGLNSVQLLGGSTINDRDNRLTQPLELCLPAPDSPDDKAQRARIAVRGRYDRHWTILETTLTDDGRICAATDRIAWLVVVFQPPPPSAAA